MARNSAGTGTGSTLDLYWDLASLDENKRINAATRLISALEQFQASHGQGQEVKVIRSEEELKTECASDVSYAVERLVKGLGSSRKGARQGFSVALTELLAKLNNVTATVVLDILFRVNEIKASMMGQELRDMMFGRLFCFMALVEAGVLERDSTRLEDVERIITETVSLSRRKSYL
ncbi:DNA-directed DNA polymerase, partial [Spiromyces aspiralis]